MKRTLPLFYFLLLAGCSSIVAIPSGHYQTPEVSGSSIGGSIGLIPFFPKRVVYPVPNNFIGTTTSTPKSGSQFSGESIQSIILPFHASVDFLEKFSIFGVSSGIGGGAQWQFLGDTAQKAHKGNWAASAVLAYYTQRLDTSGISIGMNSSTISGTVAAESEVYSIVAGYRLLDDWGIGLNFYLQPIYGYGNGFIDGGPTRTDVTTQSTDIGLGIQIYGTPQKAQLLISPTWVRIEDPLQHQVNIVPFWQARASYVF